MALIDIIEPLVIHAADNDSIHILADGSAVTEYNILTMDLMIKMHNLGKQHKSRIRVRAVSMEHIFDATANHGEITGKTMGVMDMMLSLLCREGDFRRFSYEQHDDAVQWLLKG